MNFTKKNSNCKITNFNIIKNITMSVVKYCQNRYKHILCSFLSRETMSMILHFMHASLFFMLFCVFHPALCFSGYFVFLYPISYYSCFSRATVRFHVFHASLCFPCYFLIFSCNSALCFSCLLCCCFFHACPF